MERKRNNLNQASVDQQRPLMRLYMGSMCSCKLKTNCPSSMGPDAKQPIMHNFKATTAFNGGAGESLTIRGADIAGSCSDMRKNAGSSLLSSTSMLVS